MTMMAINEDFFRSLPESHQATIVSAGRQAGQIERGVSLAEEARVKASLSDHGVEVVRMSPERQAEFRQAALGVYETFAPRYGQDVVDAVRAVK